MQGEDELLRPGQALFGYYCAKPGNGLSTAQAAALVKRIRVRPRSRQITSAPVAAEQDRLAKRARAGATGTPSFPFALAEVYVLHFDDS